MSTVQTSNEFELPALPLSGAAPAEIRTALHPEYREEFDRDYTAAIKEAARTRSSSPGSSTSSNIGGCARGSRATRTNIAGLSAVPLSC
jgi:hypothetical protein